MIIESEPVTNKALLFKTEFLLSSSGHIKVLKFLARTINTNEVFVRKSSFVVKRK